MPVEAARLHCLQQIEAGVGEEGESGALSRVSVAWINDTRAERPFGAHCWCCRRMGTRGGSVRRQASLLGLSGPCTQHVESLSPYGAASVLLNQNRWCRSSGFLRRASSRAMNEAPEFDARGTVRPRFPGYAIVPCFSGLPSTSSACWAWV